MNRIIQCFCHHLKLPWFLLGLRIVSCTVGVVVVVAMVVVIVLVLVTLVLVVADAPSAEEEVEAVAGKGPAMESVSYDGYILKGPKATRPERLPGALTGFNSLVQKILLSEDVPPLITTATCIRYTVYIIYTPDLWFFDFPLVSFFRSSWFLLLRCCQACSREFSFEGDVWSHHLCASREGRRKRVRDDEGRGGVRGEKW